MSYIHSACMRGGVHTTGDGAAPRAVHWLAGAVLSLGATFLAAPAMAQTPPSLPPTAAAPTPLWAESFSTGMSLSTAVGLDTYNGGLYTADPDWLPGANACNGWVLNSASTMPTTDSGCTAAGGEAIGHPTPAHAWMFLQTMASVLSGFDGDNYAVASMTNGGSQSAGYQLKAQPTTAPLTAGHYYAAAVDFAEVHCRSDDTTKTAWRDAVETITLTSNAGSYPQTATPCTLFPTPVSSAAGPIHLGMLYSGVLLASTSENSISGLQIYNATASSNANDLAFNLPQILDVTPQLYKSYNSSSDITVGPSDPATLTYTIMNTTDVLAKNGWSFADALPPGVSVVAGSEATDCDTTGTAGLTASGSTVTMAGNLTAGQASCTITVQVESSTPGAYPNGPANFTPPTGLIGLLPPNTATLNVATLIFNKTVSSITDSSGNPLPLSSVAMEAGDKITYQFAVTNPESTALTGLDFDDSAAHGFTGTGSAPAISCPTTTVAAGGTVTCTGTYTVTVADVAAGSITNGAVACPTGCGQGVEPSPPSTVTTTIVNPQLAVTQKVNQTLLVAGEAVTFTFTVKNTGNTPLIDVTIDDTSFTGSGALSAVTCVPTALAVGATTTCTATYTVTAADVAAGSITNVGNAIGWVSGVPETPGTLQVPARGEAIGQSNKIMLRGAGAGTTAPVPALDARALALLALLLGGLAYFVRRKMRR